MPLKFPKDLCPSDPVSAPLHRLTFLQLGGETRTTRSFASPTAPPAALESPAASGAASPHTAAVGGRRVTAAPSLRSGTGEGTGRALHRLRATGFGQQAVRRLPAQIRPPPLRQVHAGAQPTGPESAAASHAAVRAHATKPLPRCERCAASELRDIDKFCSALRLYYLVSWLSCLLFIFAFEMQTAIRFLLTRPDCLRSN